MSAPAVVHDALHAAREEQQTVRRQVAALEGEALELEAREQTAHEPPAAGAAVLSALAARAVHLARLAALRTEEKSAARRVEQEVAIANGVIVARAFGRAGTLSA